MAYCGSGLEICLDRNFDAINASEAIAVVGHGSTADFDFVIATANELFCYQRDSTSERWRQYLPGLSAMGSIAPSESISPRLAVVDSSIRILDALNGNTLSEIPWTPGFTPKHILAGNASGGTEQQFIAWGPYGIAAFGTAPLRLLWQRTDRALLGATLIDSTSGSAKDLIIVDSSRTLYKLDAAGSDAVVGTTLSYYPSALGSIQSSSGSNYIVAPPSGNWGAGLPAINANNLQSIHATLLGYIGWFNKFQLADIAGNGVEKLVGLAERPWGNDVSDSWLRIVDPSTRREEWSSSFPTAAIPGSKDKYLDLSIGRAMGNGSRQIYLIGGPYGLGINQQLTIVDGATRALVSRRPLPFGAGYEASHVHAFVLDNVEKLAVITVRYSSSAPEVRVHVLDASTLNVDWTSPVLTDDPNIQWTGLLQTEPHDRPMLYAAMWQTGVVAIDLGNRSIEFTLTGHPVAATVSADTTGAYLAYVEESGPSLKVFDANTGSVVRSVPLMTTFSAMAVDPQDANRYVMARDHELCSFNLDLGRCEGHSKSIGSWGGARMFSRVKNGDSQFLIGNGYGVWSSTLGDDTLFSSEFE